jgi:hypothetical protein
MKNISEHHICNMIRFAREYGTSILQQLVAKLPEQTLLSAIHWGHHCLLIEKNQGCTGSTLGHESERRVGV